MLNTYNTINHHQYYVFNSFKHTNTLSHRHTHKDTHTESQTHTYTNTLTHIDTHTHIKRQIFAYSYNSTVSKYDPRILLHTSETRNILSSFSLYLPYNKFSSFTISKKSKCKRRFICNCHLL